MVLMRAAGRTLLTLLWVGLICGAIGASSRSCPPAAEGATGFHQPVHPAPSIEAAPVNAGTSSADEWIGASATGVALNVSVHARLAAPRNSCVITPAPETALYQRPPPRELFS
jgi:hypothetical protein